MLSPEIMCNALSAFSFPSVAGGNEASHAMAILKRAVIVMLQNKNDPDSVFLGTLLSDIRKITSDHVARMTLEIDGPSLILEANIKWVCFLNEFGLEYVIYELRAELAKLVLSHPEIIKMYTDTADKLIARSSMDLCVSDYMRRTAYANTTPPCPVCVKLMQIGADKLPNLPKLADFTQWSEKNSFCPYCGGVGRLALSLSAIQRVAQQHYKDKQSFRLYQPYEAGMNNHRAYFNYLKRELPQSMTGASDPRAPFLEDLLSNSLEYENSFDKAVAVSTLNHAYSQAGGQGFSKGGSGSLMGAFDNLRRVKKVPYILQLRGSLGASMQDQTIPTRYRPNRRFGYEYPGSKAVPKQRYVFALDTSGSISRKDVEKMINEFMNLAHYSEKIECRVMFFHTSVYFDKDMLQYTKDDLASLQSGGTNFDAVFESVFSDKDKREVEPAVLAIYTDGDCSINFAKKDVKGKVIWLLTPDGTTSYIKRWDKCAEIIRLDKSE